MRNQTGVPVEKFSKIISFKSIDISLGGACLCVSILAKKKGTTEKVLTKLHLVGEFVLDLTKKKIKQKQIDWELTTKYLDALNLEPLSI